MNATNILNLDENLRSLQEASASESFFALLRHIFFCRLTGVLGQCVPEFLGQDPQIKQLDSPRIAPGNMALGCDTPKQSHPPTGFIDLRGCYTDNPNPLLRRWVVPKGKGSTMLKHVSWFRMTRFLGYGYCMDHISTPFSIAAIWAHITVHDA